MTTNATITFAPGSSYKHNFIGDSDLWATYTVERRTEKSVWIKDRDGKVQRKSIRTRDGSEYVSLGSYSFAPSLWANSPADEPKPEIEIREDGRWTRNGDPITLAEARDHFDAVDADWSHKSYQAMTAVLREEAKAEELSPERKAEELLASRKKNEAVARAEAEAEMATVKQITRAIETSESIGSVAHFAEELTSRAPKLRAATEKLEEASALVQTAENLVSQLKKSGLRSPLQTHYHEVKATLPEGTLLLFRIGDFFEAFDEDAIQIANALNLALTKRNGAPMCGIAAHALEASKATLLTKGYSTLALAHTSL